jgi:Flp pilus assembly pilin Flp
MGPARSPASPTTASPTTFKELNDMNLRTWYQLLRAAAKRDEGQTMAEYGVVLAVITVGIIVALGALALAISGKLGTVTNVLGSNL